MSIYDAKWFQFCTASMYCQSYKTFSAKKHWLNLLFFPSLAMQDFKILKHTLGLSISYDTNKIDATRE